MHVNVGKELRTADQGHVTALSSSFDPPDVIIRITISEIYFLFFLAPSDWKFPGETTSECDIVGYLVTTGPCFYQLCPAEHRQSWFDEFQRSNFKCFT